MKASEKDLIIVSFNKLGFTTLELILNNFSSEDENEKLIKESTSKMVSSHQVVPVESKSEEGEVSKSDLYVVKMAPLHLEWIFKTLNNVILKGSEVPVFNNLVNSLSSYKRIPYEMLQKQAEAAEQAESDSEEKPQE